MNRHFTDTRYYLRRAGETAKKGVAEELGPIADRVKDLTGDAEEPDPGRLAEIRADLEDVQSKAEGEAKQAIMDAREKIGAVRTQEA